MYLLVTLHYTVGTYATVKVGNLEEVYYYDDKSFICFSRQRREMCFDWVVFYLMDFDLSVSNGIFLLKTMYWFFSCSLVNK